MDEAILGPAEGGVTMLMMMNSPRKKGGHVSIKRPLGNGWHFGVLMKSGECIPYLKVC